MLADTLELLTRFDPPSRAPHLVKIVGSSKLGDAKIRQLVLPALTLGEANALLPAGEATAFLPKLFLLLNEPVHQFPVATDVLCYRGQK